MAATRFIASRSWSAPSIRHRGVIRHALVAACLALLAGWSLSLPPAPVRAQDAEETPEVLPPGAGRDETFYACTPCHGTAIIRAQGMSRERWDATIDWMVERHGMPEIDDIDRKLVLEYLASNFPSRQRGRTNPFLR